MHAPKPGDVLVGQSGIAYVLDRELGVGATSRVYLAYPQQEPQRQVAIKVLRQNLPQSLEESFFREIDVLRALNEAEERLDDTMQTVPHLYEVQRNQSPRFLVLEMARGVSLDDVVARKPYYLSEQNALRILIQTARVLYLLHEYLQRSYTDFQLKNIWWNEETQRVLILDWNHVSDIGAARTEEDLDLLGVYFYRMLVGKGAQTAGEPAQMLARRAGQRWEEVSLGSRQLALKMLSPNRQQRFQRARDIWETAERLLTAWQQTGQTLSREVLRLSTQRNPESTAQAYALLDLTERKNDIDATVLKDVRAKVHALELPTQHTWSVGQTYYEAGNYPEALTRWQPIAQETGDLHQWRRVLMAQAGTNDSQAFSALRSQVETAIYQLEHEHNAQAAEQMLSELMPDTPLTGLDGLYAEVQARSSIARALQSKAYQHYQEAANAYKQADAFLQHVPYAALVRDEEGWHDLQEQSAQLASEGRTLQNARARQEAVQNALDTGIPARAVQTLTEYLRTAPDDQHILRIGYEYGLRLKETQRWHYALDILRVIADYGVGEHADLARDMTTNILQDIQQQRALVDQRSDGEHMSEETYQTLGSLLEYDSIQEVLKLVRELYSIDKGLLDNPINVFCLSLKLESKQNQGDTLVNRSLSEGAPGLTKHRDDSGRSGS